MAEVHISEITRQRFLDMAKGLGIWCIVFLHYENGVLPWQANVFIGSFMITIFYVVAGWLSASKSPIDTRTLVRKRLQSLGKPYLYWCLIILGFDLILWAFGYYGPYMIARETYKAVVLRGIGTLWFLPALFFGEIIWNSLRTKPWLFIVVILIAMVVYINLEGDFFSTRRTNFWRIVEAPFNVISKAFDATIVVSAGYYVHKLYKYLRLDTPVVDFLVGVGLCIIGYFTSIYLHLVLGENSGRLWMLFAPILGPIGFILVFKSMETVKTIKFLEYWGRNSLGLMVTHYSIVLVLVMIFFEKILDSEFIGWATIIAFVLTIPLQFIITEAINRYAPKLLGKK